MLEAPITALENRCEQCSQPATVSAPDLIEIFYELGFHRFMPGTLHRGCPQHLPRTVMYFLDGRRLDIGSA
jgi:hypothetical protein